MTVEINLRIIMKNHAADPETGFFAKSISKFNDSVGVNNLNVTYQIKIKL